MENRTLLKGGFTTTDVRLDRIPQFDERSRAYPIRELVPEKQKSYTWSCGVFLDQGPDGACTGFSQAHLDAARPKVSKTTITNEFAQHIYTEAKKVDEWPGENYEGSSVLAATKVNQTLGFIKEYRWAFSLDDLILALGNHGPAVLGINWYNTMFNTDKKGVIKIGSGSVAGGHAILCNGVNIKDKLFRLHNSWGKSWGINGEAFISFDDLGRLLSEQGEAMIPVKK